MSARSRSWGWLPAFVCLLSWGASASAAIDELELIVDGGASTFPTPTAYGSATQVSGQHWELTPSSANQSGGITYTGLPVGDVWSISGEFWTGGGTGADAFYVYTWATSDPAAEDTADQQYTFAYDEWSDEIQILYNGFVLASAGEAGMDSSTWRAFRVDCTEGFFEVYLDGSLKVTYDERMHLYGIAIGDRFGFGARTGPTETNEHRVRNMVWDVTSSAGTSAFAVSAEGAAPTFPTGTAFGGAVDGGLAWQLDFVGGTDHGGVTYSGVDFTERFDLTGEFRSGGGTGADIFYAFLWADTEPVWQSDTNGQYAVSFDEYNDQVKLIYNGATLASYNHSTLDDREWHAFQISCDTGVFDVWIDGSPIITYDDSANFAARATGTLSGFAGGSGGETNAHQVRNMAVATGATSTPSVVWSAPYVRQAYNGSSDYTAIPDATIQSDTSLTVETWFRTNTHGVLLGYQEDPVGVTGGYYTPALYVATDGQLRGVFWSNSIGTAAITSAVPASGDLLDDGAWHHVALIGDDDQSTMYIDGQFAGVAVGLIEHMTQAINQVGAGYTLSWPFGNGGWHYFGGEIAGFNVWDGPLSAATVTTIAATPPGLPDVAWSTSTGTVTTYDGVDDYTVAPDALIQSRVAMTVETWFRTTETRGGILGYQNTAYPTGPTQSVPSLYIANTGEIKSALYLASAAAPLSSSSAVNDGAWHHVAVIGDVDRHHMYVDGVSTGTYVSAIDGLSMTSNQVGLAVSNWLGGTGTWDFFRGDLADFNVWDGTLTATEVASIAATAPTAPVANLTASLAGGTDYLDVGADASLLLTDEYTLEAWIRPTGSGIGGGNTIVCREGEYLLSWWPGDETIRYAVGNAGWVWINTGYTTPLGVWRHIAFTSSDADGAIRLYADGVEVYSVAGGGTIADSIPAQNNVYLGDRQGGAESFEGDLDEVRIWNVARSAAEIASTYPRTLTAGEATAVAGLVGYWNFDDDTTTDITGAGNDGTFIGNAGILGSQLTRCACFSR